MAADECRFYYYDRGYCCMYLKMKNNSSNYEVDDDWVKRYCWGYHCDECPYFQMSKG